MKQVTKSEFLAHVGSFGAWVEIRRMYASRCIDSVYSFKGKDIAWKTQVLKRGKVNSEEFSIDDSIKGGA